MLAHLSDIEILTGFRLRQILSEDHHTIQVMDENGWAKRYDTVDVEAALANLRGGRAWNLALIRKMSADDWKRESVHPDRGPEPLETTIRMYAGHTLNHLAQLESIPV